MGIMQSLRAVTATADEIAAPMPGDDLVARPDAVMDRAFSLPHSPDRVWPWIAQLGKARAGWYLPRSIESAVPRRRRAARAIEERWQHLVPGDVIPDYGGPRETFEVVAVEPPHSLVYASVRGAMNVSWSIGLTDTTTASTSPGTRVHLRLRLGPVRRTWLVDTGGELIDLLTIAGMAAGLRERLDQADDN